MSLPTEYLPTIVDQLDAGILVIDKQFNIVMWNRYMATHSQIEASEVIGKNLFAQFPELPETWLTKKIKSVIVLKSASFTSWEQRPWLFKFSHNRPVTGGVDWMHQNCVMTPLKNARTGEVEYISITIHDVTDIAIKHTHLTNLMEKLERNSVTDGLTQIYNRQFLQETFAKEYSRFARNNHLSTLIIFDLDHFKSINDTYGHLGGDQVLRTVAARISEMVRTQDIFGRYGGEEFCLILPMTDQEGGWILAERIRQRMADEPVPFGDQMIRATISMGIAQLDTKFADAAAWIQAADDCLYHAKRTGRNRVIKFTDIRPNQSAPDNQEEAERAT